MLCFNILPDGKTIQVHCDQHGMSVLLEKLAHLVRDPDHVHLRGPSAGGRELTETTPFGEPAACEVIIGYSPDYESPAVG